MYSYALASMMGVLIAAGGLAYTHLHQGHIRVDVFWRFLSPRGKAIADIIGTFIMFFPLMFALLYGSVDRAIFSFLMHEVSRETYWYPIIWPIRIVMLIGVFLFTVQGVAKLVRDLYVLRRSEL
jgi:TRAP-type mannitol/chloroaromatic compound transport system permease small subunit